MGRAIGAEGGERSDPLFVELEGGSDSGGTGVLQPVLQYTPAGGWGIKSWYVGSGGTIATDVVATPSGATVEGINSQFKSNSSWVITGRDVYGGEPATLYVTQARAGKMTYAYEVLEAYNVGSTCGMYPAEGKVEFKASSVAFDFGDPVPKEKVAWDTYACPSGPGCTGRASCKEAATADADADVVISFSAS